MAGPLHDPSFLEGPLVTILQSLGRLSSGDISLPDITESFSVLDARVRDHAKDLNKGEKFPAIEGIKMRGSTTSPKIMLAMRDAILLALQPPIPIDQPSTSTGRRKLTREEGKRANEASHLCQAAIRFTADVFALQGLQLLFGMSILSSWAFLLTSVFQGYMD